MQTENQRERLVELIDKALNDWLKGETTLSVSEYVSEYLMSNNVVVLPCMVGDAAYCIYRGEVTKGIVRLIRPFVSEQKIIFKGNFICEVDNLFIDDGTKEEVELYVVFEKPYGIERVAYFSREEAEKALSERKRNGT